MVDGARVEEVEEEEEEGWHVLILYVVIVMAVNVLLIVVDVNVLVTQIAVGVMSARMMRVLFVIATGVVHAPARSLTCDAPVWSLVPIGGWRGMRT